MPFRFDSGASQFQHVVWSYPKFICSISQLLTISSFMYQPHKQERAATDLRGHLTGLAEKTNYRTNSRNNGPCP